MERLRNLGLLFICFLFVSGCLSEDTEEETVAEPDQTIEEDVNDRAPLTEVGACFADQYNGDQENVEALDILIVSYQSINLKPQRTRLANNLDSLFAQIPEEVDYRVGVMQGLGSHSNKSGKLYRRNSEPHVLRSDVLTTSEITDYVEKKMNPPTVEVVLESIFGGGSMGLYSLYKGVTEGKDLLKSQGLLRDNASLLVLFVSDQADVCAQYPEGVQTFNKKARSHPLFPRSRAFENDCFYQDEEGETQELTAQTVYQTLKGTVAESVNVSGVFYNNKATVPHAAWKEFGYGYNDIVEHAGGISHDLASRNYDEALTKIGMVSSAALIKDDKFNLQTSRVLVSTIDVEVDGESVDFSYIPEVNQVHLAEPRSSLSDVEVSYCEKKEEEQPEEKQNIMLASGGYFSCVLHGNGTVRCWGQNNFGQLGLGHTDTIGDDEPISSIDPLVFDEPIVSIAAGASHACALSESGKVYCWGQNTSGQLGLGDTLNRGDTQRASELEPIDLGGVAEKIYTGTSTTCAILEDEKVRCWGGNTVGQLGLGHTESVGDDEAVTSVDPLTFDKELSQLDLSTISNHICALFVDGSQKCWGYNLRGQLGLGDTESRGDNESLDQVPNFRADNDHNPILIATGNQHTCVLLDNQNIKCWGQNFANMFDQPVDYLASNGDSPSDYPSIDVGTSVLSLTTGNFFNCAVTTTHQVKCWGDNRSGQAGYKSDETTVGEDELTSDLPYVDIGDAQVVDVVGGGFHVCALTKDDGKVLCWGDNRFGQLGYGDTLSTADAGAPTPLERGALIFDEEVLP